MANYWNSLFYHDTDYAPFAVPTSEGGRGPENAREVLGLEFDHHAGMRTRLIGEGETPEQVAYRYVRETHEFLTNDNHTWEFVKADGPDHWMSRIEVTKNENSGYFAFNPWGAPDGPGAHWFSNSFRVATVGMIAAEIDADFRRAQKYLDEAAEQRDSIRGRKRASQLRSFAHSALWLAEVAPSRRWPEHFPNLRKEAA